MKSNIILIGMPGVGKTTLGIALARTLSRPHIDSDDLVAQHVAMPVAQYIKERGISEFKQIESQVLLNTQLTDHIISTGGSVVYMTHVVEHLKTIGTMVYLENNYPIIEQRILASPRALVIKEGQSLEQLYLERVALYKKYADITVNLEHLDVDSSVQKLIKQLGLKW